MVSTIGFGVIIGFIVGYSLANEEKQCVFYLIEEGVSAPEHAHCALVGTVVDGEMTLEIDGKIDLLGPGDVYRIPEGTNHRASFSKSSVVIELYDRPDRYPIRI